MDRQALKKAAAAAALAWVKPNMRLGIGTGSTAEEFIRLLAERVKEGLNIIGVPTSGRSRALCEQLGVPLTTLDETPQLDLAIDGADELDRNLQLIKGGGGALLREKIAAYATKTMLVIADESKLVARLGTFPLPIEVNKFGLQATKLAIAAKSAALGLNGRLTLRQNGETPGAAAGDAAAPFITDGGHYILDAHYGAITEPAKLAAALCQVAGVVEHGLFFHPDCHALLAQSGGKVEHIQPAA